MTIKTCTTCKHYQHNGLIDQVLRIVPQHGCYRETDKPEHRDPVTGYVGKGAPRPLSCREERSYDARDWDKVHCTVAAKFYERRN
jgi:hypothetical protein